MKITRKILLEMIEEQLDDLTPEEEEDLPPDVERIKAAMGKSIDNKEEYAKLMSLVTKMAEDIPGAESVLIDLQKQLPEFVAKIDGSINDQT